MITGSFFGDFFSQSSLTRKTNTLAWDDDEFSYAQKEFELFGENAGEDV